MKNAFKLFAFLFVISILFAGCEFVKQDEEIKHGKEAFLGNFTTAIDYKNSVIELAIDMDIDGDHNLTTNPPTNFSPIDSTTRAAFIDAYFVAGSASVVLQGSDSIKYTDAKRILIGCVKNDSVFFAPTTIGTSPIMPGVTIFSTSLNATGNTVSNNINIDYAVLGTGSVVISPTVTKYGIVRGTIKTISKK